MKRRPNTGSSRIAALALAATLLPAGAFAQTSGPSTAQLLSLLQAQQKQLNEMKAALC